MASSIPDDFRTTRWSVVLAAGQDDPGARAALGELCETYWKPVHGYVRRQGESSDSAADVTQEFFTRILADQTWRAADANRGRFRAFLLGCLKNFLHNRRRDARAKKRGGGKAPLSLDGAEIGDADASEPTREYQRDWALTLLDRTLERVRQRYMEDGKKQLFDTLRCVLDRSEDAAPVAALAAELELTEGAVKVAAHRLRQRFGESLRAEIRETVNTAAEVEDEIRELFSALRA